MLPSFYQKVYLSKIELVFDKGLEDNISLKFILASLFTIYAKKL